MKAKKALTLEKTRICGNSKLLFRIGQLCYLSINHSRFLQSLLFRTLCSQAFVNAFSVFFFISIGSLNFDHQFLFYLVVHLLVLFQVFFCKNKNQKLPWGKTRFKCQASNYNEWMISCFYSLIFTRNPDLILYHLLRSITFRVVSILSTVKGLWLRP